MCRINKESVRICRIENNKSNILSSSYGQLLTVTYIILIGVNLLSKKV